MLRVHIINGLDAINDVKMLDPFFQFYNLNHDAKCLFLKVESVNSDRILGAILDGVCSDSITDLQKGLLVQTLSEYSDLIISSQTKYLAVLFFSLG